jgi:hypothetical protein
LRREAQRLPVITMAAHGVARNRHGLWGLALICHDKAVPYEPKGDLHCMGALWPFSIGRQVSKWPHPAYVPQKWHKMRNCPRGELWFNRVFMMSS